jgi:hypothetical protein
LQDFDGNRPSEASIARFVDVAHATGSKGSFEAVGADRGAGSELLRLFRNPARREFGCGSFEESAGVLIAREHAFDVIAEVLICLAGGREESVAILGLVFESRLEDSFHLLPAVGAHGNSFYTRLNIFFEAVRLFAGRVRLERCRQLSKNETRKRNHENQDQRQRRLDRLGQLIYTAFAIERIQMKIKTNVNSGTAVWGS